MPAVPRRDSMTGGALVADIDHHNIHAGESYVSHYEGVGAAAGQETAIGFLTPVAATGVRIHLIVDAWANDESVLEIREGPAIVLGSGVDLACRRRHRLLGDGGSAMRNNDAVPNVSQLTSYNVAQAAAGNLAGGIILHHETLAIATAAPFNSVLNGVSRGHREFILIPNTEHVVIMTQSGAGAATHNLILNWYEHIDSNY